MAGAVLLSARCRLTLPPAHYDWTGIYLGGNVGAGLLDDLVSQGARHAGDHADRPTRVIRSASSAARRSASITNSRPWWSAPRRPGRASNISGSATVPTDSGRVRAQRRDTSAPLWLATATGRIGYAANDVLFYAKGGGAWMNVEYTQDILVAGALAGPTQVISDNRTGFTAGVGIEYGLTENWSAQARIRFLRFRHQEPIGFGQTPVSIQSNLHTLTFGSITASPGPADRCSTSSGRAFRKPPEAVSPQPQDDGDNSLRALAKPSPFFTMFDRAKPSAHGGGARR